MHFAKLCSEYTITCVFVPCWLRKCEALVKHALLTADAYCLLEPVATVLSRHAAW